MKKVLIVCGGIVAFPFVLVFLLMIFVFVMSFFNGRVDAPTDFSKSPLLATPPAPPAKPFTLKIATFNIQDTYVVGFNRPARMRAIGRVLQQLDPDVVGFQEAFVEDERAILIQALGNSRLAHSQYFGSGTVGSGVFIMSAFPIQEAWFHRYTTANEWYKVWEGDWWAGKGVGLARIALPNGGFLDLYNTHAQAGYGNARYRLVRKDQMLELAQFINDTRSKTSPAFLTGDMNCGPGKEDFEAAVAAAKLVRMMSIDTRLDHIFTVENPKFTAELLETVPIAERVQEDGKTFDLSDHSGYMSTIRVTPVS